ncbi:hypothetical protein EG328_008270 [Venturia inaequalis]|uniref:F-box domain-containing protein n=1 Tax=Venturia inaequalis TaxID=5025 RepID=A0A8H3UCY8_VENIN|nr:hypothetical protein EG328_008270 [Venturia inaequalis]
MVLCQPRLVEDNTPNVYKTLGSGNLPRCYNKLHATPKSTSTIMSTNSISTSSAASMPIMPTLQGNTATPDLLGLPQEVQDMIYDEVASEFPLQCRPNTSRQATNDEFRTRHALLFVNHEISDAFKPLLANKTPYIYIAIDSLEPGVSDTTACLDNPYHEELIRVQFHITTTGMQFKRISDLLCFIMGLWGPHTWEMDHISVIYTDPTKSKVGIWYGEYTIQAMGPRNFEVTFVKKTVDEEGMVEVTKVLRHPQDRWWIDWKLPRVEHEHKELRNGNAHGKDAGTRSL